MLYATYYTVTGAHEHFKKQKSTPPHRIVLETRKNAQYISLLMDAQEEEECPERPTTASNLLQLPTPAARRLSSKSDSPVN